MPDQAWTAFCERADRLLTKAQRPLNPTQPPPVEAPTTTPSPHPTATQGGIPPDPTHIDWPSPPTQTTQPTPTPTAPALPAAQEAPVPSTVQPGEPVTSTITPLPPTTTLPTTYGTVDVRQTQGRTMYLTPTGTITIEHVTPEKWFTDFATNPDYPEKLTERQACHCCGTHDDHYKKFQRQQRDMLELMDPQHWRTPFDYKACSQDEWDAFLVAGVDGMSPYPDPRWWKDLHAMIKTWTRL